MSSLLRALPFWFGLLLLATPRVGLALDIPTFRGPVQDLAQVLSPEDRQVLSSTLQSYEARTGHQFAFLSVRSLQGMGVEQYALAVAERWKLGRPGVDDGLLFLVAASEHEMRVEVGYGLEHLIPDAIASRALREIASPRFKRGEFRRGVVDTFWALMHAADHEGELPAVEPIDEPWDWKTILGLLFIVPCVGSFVAFFVFFIRQAVSGKRERAEPPPLPSSTPHESAPAAPEQSVSAAVAAWESESERREDSKGDDWDRGGSFGGGGASGSW